MIDRKRAGVLAQVGRYEFDPKAFAVIEGEPIVYWWTKEFLEQYARAPKLGQQHKALNGLSTQNNTRFVRIPWEVRRQDTFISRNSQRCPLTQANWYPYIKGGEGAEWFEPISWLVPWGPASVELRVFLDQYQKLRPGGFIKHEDHYFHMGIAFTVIGATFAARAHRFSSIFGQYLLSGIPLCGSILLS